MFCKNCGKKISDNSKFCLYCGEKISNNIENNSIIEEEEINIKKEDKKEKIEYSREKFIDIYKSISEVSCNSEKDNPNFSDYYKKYLSEIYNDSNILSFAFKAFNIVGYNLQLSFLFFGDMKLEKLQNEVKKIIELNIDNYEKIIKIKEYLYNAGDIRVDLDKKILENFIPIDWDEFVKNVRYISEDFISSLAKEMHVKSEMYENFRDPGYINVLDGYIFSVAEKIVEETSSNNKSNKDIQPEKENNILDKKEEKKVDIRSKLEINFHKQDEASIFLENSTSYKEEKFGEILLFCSFVIRTLVNLGNNSTSSALAKLLTAVKINTKELMNHQSPDEAKLIDYPGFQGRKRFVANLKYSNDNFNFQYAAKGFGFFASGMGYYAPNSVILLMKYLYNKRKNDKEYIEALKSIATQCGIIFSSGKLEISNQNSFILSIISANYSYDN